MRPSAELVGDDDCMWITINMTQMTAAMFDVVRTNPL